MTDEFDQRKNARTLVEVIRGNDHERKPQERATNEEHLAVRGDATLAQMLREIDADIEKRDALVPQYVKAEEKSRRASGESMGLYRDIKALDDRVAKTREAFNVLKARGRTGFGS